MVRLHVIFSALRLGGYQKRGWDRRGLAPHFHALPNAKPQLHALIIAPVYKTTHQNSSQPVFGVTNSGCTFSAVFPDAGKDRLVTPPACPFEATGLGIATTPELPS